MDLEVNQNRDSHKSDVETKPAVVAVDIAVTSVSYGTFGTSLADAEAKFDEEEVDPNQISLFDQLDEPEASKESPVVQASEVTLDEVKTLEAKAEELVAQIKEAEAVAADLEAQSVKLEAVIEELAVSAPIEPDEVVALSLEAEVPAPTPTEPVAAASEDEVLELSSERERTEIAELSQGVRDFNPTDSTDDLQDGELKKDLAAIPDKMAFKIGEVADLLGVKQYVLRYWETEFEALKPKKSAHNQRMYSRRDVETAFLIKKLLYRDRFSIEGARKALRSLKKKVKEEKNWDTVLQRYDGARGQIQDLIEQIQRVGRLFS